MPLDIVQRWFSIGEGIRQVEELEREFRLLPLSMNATSEYARELQEQIRDIKLQTGLVDKGDEDFREFYKNWKRIRESAITPQLKRDALKWILRRLRQASKAVT